MEFPALWVGRWESCQDGRSVLVHFLPQKKSIHWWLIFASYLNTIEPKRSFLWVTLSSSPTSICAKNCRRSGNLPYFQVMLACHSFHGCWQKTQDLWIWNIGLYYSLHSKQHELHVRIRSPSSPSRKSHEGNAEWPRWILHMQWVCITPKEPQS